MNKKGFTLVEFLALIVIISIVAMMTISIFDTIPNIFDDDYDEGTFRLLCSPDNSDVGEMLKSYASENGIDLEITYQDDLKAIDTLNGDTYYDAVWMSNSVWLYMLENNSTSNSKSININPVVFGIKKSKATELGFVDNEVKNKDIVNAIKDGKLKYVMTSVTKTNTGLISYLGFLNALSGSPEILTSDMLDNKELVSNLTTLFSGVERVSGDEDFLRTMFLNSDTYEAVVATESSLISINKELVSSNKEPLYLIYPSDGVAINDSPFAYLDHNQEKEDEFYVLQSYLLSNSTQEELEKMGKRTWYGGIKEDADSNSFRKEWGIDTTKYLIPLKYPSKDVMDEAISLYIDYFRKPTSVAFCLDYSGSMYGDGEEELKEAMNLILNYEEASKEKIQFSEKDKIYVIPFSNENLGVYKTENGRNTEELLNNIYNNSPYGGTNIYDCSKEALKLVNEDSDEYTKTVILMTDGLSNMGSYYELKRYYEENGNNVPIYSIMFGNSEESELEKIAELTNAKVFDGRNNLLAAFKEVRSYN